MEIQRNILLFFVNIRTPFLTLLSQAVTLFGETVTLLTVCLFVFYCLDKKKGFSFIMTLFSADLVMNTVKAIVRMPRPFMTYKEITCLKESTATGYSFPSGHATHAGVLFTSLLKQKKRLTAFCIIMILLIGVSRLYLACHWPLDVLVGWAIGICFSLFVFDLFAKLYEDKDLMLRVFPSAGIACLAVGFIFAIAVEHFEADYRTFSDLTKNLTLLGAALLAFSYEEKYCCIEVPQQWSKKIINFSGAIIGSLFFLVVLKIIIPNTLILACVRYTLVSIWDFGVWPIIIHRWIH